jgi:hypothetical protein
LLLNGLEGPSLLPSPFYFDAQNIIEVCLTAEKIEVLKGHDFSRADKASKMSWGFSS